MDETRYDRGWQWAFDMGKEAALTGSRDEVPFPCRKPLMGHAFYAGFTTVLAGLSPISQEYMRRQCGIHARRIR